MVRCQPLHPEQQASPTFQLVLGITKGGINPIKITYQAMLTYVLKALTALPSDGHLVALVLLLK